MWYTRHGNVVINFLEMPEFFQYHYNKIKLKKKCRKILAYMIKVTASTVFRRGVSHIIPLLLFLILRSFKFFFFVFLNGYT